MPETITKTYELISVKGVKGWIRDSWARRQILALQQAIAGIVFPTASTANPQMDGTAAPGVSTDYSRADHVHPHDTAKQDALTAAQLAAINSGVTAEFVTSKFAVITCTLASSNTYGAYTALPTGFTKDNCVMLVIQVPDGSGERIGQGIFTTTNMRLFAEMTTSGVRIYNNTSRYYGVDVKVVLMRTDI